jgi:hypothetical protein
MMTQDIAFARQQTSDVDILQERVNELESELELVRSKGKLISQELDLFRQRRIVFWSDRFRNQFDAWNLMNPGFQQLKDDTSLNVGPVDGYRLVPTVSLLRVPFSTYRVRLKKPNLRAILLAPVVDVPLVQGEICIRLQSTAPDRLVASASVPVSCIRDDQPTVFEFPPVIESDQCELLLRVFVQGVDAPVRIFELRKYGWGGFGRTYTKPFAGYEFA